MAVTKKPFEQERTQTLDKEQKIVLVLVKSTAVLRYSEYRHERNTRRTMV